MVNLFLTDPPYNVNYEGGTKDKLTIKNDNLDNKEFKNFLTKAFNNAFDVMKNGASYYVWHSSREAVNFITSLEEAGFEVKQQLIWNKNSIIMGRQDYQWKHEPCLYGWKGGASHYFINDRTLTTVLDFDKPNKNDLHPTMKPIELLKHQINNSTKENDIVLDLFGGSGSTLIACEELKRNCYMLELDPKYVDVIIQRWENFTGKKAVLLNE